MPPSLHRSVRLDCATGPVRTTGGGHLCVQYAVLTPRPCQCLSVPITISELFLSFIISFICLSLAVLLASLWLPTLSSGSCRLCFFLKRTPDEMSLGLSHLTRLSSELKGERFSHSHNASRLASSQIVGQA